MEDTSKDRSVAGPSWDRQENGKDPVLTHRIPYPVNKGDTERPDHAFLFSSVMVQYVVAAHRPPRVLMDLVDVDLEKGLNTQRGRVFPCNRFTAARRGGY